MSKGKYVSISVSCFVLFWAGILCAALGGNDLTVRWGRQLITDTDDVARNAAAGSDGGIYFVINKQSKDASGNTTSRGRFLLKYSQQGEQLWSKALGPGIADTTGLTPDDNGNIYVFGHVSSTSGWKTIGKYDAFYAKYDKAGTLLWRRQLGTAEHDVCTGLDFDASGNLYISGYTYGNFAGSNKGGADMFIAAYTQAGVPLWQDQTGTAVDDRAVDIRLGDDNDVYICGNTSGSLARENNGFGDFVAARYQRSGKRLWLHQYGTIAFDSVMCMEIGELGHLYLGCRTRGNAGSRSPQRRDLDSCLVSISKKGKLLWTRQFGTGAWDGTWDMARFMDGSGDILISGCQIPLKSKCQAYNRRYSSQGELIWTKEFREYSSSGGTCGRVVAIDSDNNVYHAGQTHADFFGVNNDTGNVYIVRFDGAKDPQVNP
ncbi:MAG: hypothetical protein GY774_35875 [Planctomycetes bacterium]|nr:hypothetical protein [Planctomycetota bacterium]